LAKKSIRFSLKGALAAGGVSPAVVIAWRWRSATSDESSPSGLGVRLLDQDLLPGGDKALLRAGLPNLLQNDERPHRGEGGDHDPDPDGVVAHYSQRRCQHRCNRYSRVILHWE